MKSIIVSGIGTNVGKTVVSAIITSLFNGTYWKPVETGSSDTETIADLLTATECTIMSPLWKIKAPKAPALAAHDEGMVIDHQDFRLPMSTSPLIIEMAGGLLVPLNQDIMLFDLLRNVTAEWVLVVRNYVGCINHTLLSSKLLEGAGIRCAGIIMNGPEDPQLESLLQQFSRLQIIARLNEEVTISSSTITKYKDLWTHLLS